MLTSQYLRFERAPTPPSRKTQVWLVLSARTLSPLGLILWRGGWRQYVFEPEPNTVWSVGCMADVEAFIGTLMAARRQRSGSHVGSTEPESTLPTHESHNTAEAIQTLERKRG